MLSEASLRIEHDFDTCLCHDYRKYPRKIETSQSMIHLRCSTVLAPIVGRLSANIGPPSPSRGLPANVIEAGYVAVTYCHQLRATPTITGNQSYVSYHSVAKLQLLDK